MQGKRIFNIVSTIFISLMLPFSVYLVGKETHIFSNAFGKPADLVVDVGTSYDSPGEVWKNLAQGGEENNRMLLSTVDLIRNLQPKYIRIDHIYDFYNIVSRDTNSELLFNWRDLDAVIGDISSTGAKPFISLSYMPNVISKGDILEVPNNWGEWEIVVQKTIEHISGINGLGISDVYYEVWNEPDLFGSYKVYGNKNYLTLYQHSVFGSSRASNCLVYKIGGPATTKLYKSWFDSLLSFVERNNLRLDFFSWHQYSKNINDYEDDWIRAYTWLGDYPKFSNIEFILSEVGPDSENDAYYDNNLGAIHTIALASTMEGNSDKVFTFEIKDGPGEEKYWGRWGILTHDKFGIPEKKPRYDALLFLNRMKGRRINTYGSGTWVKAFSKIDGRTVRIMVVNYDSSGKNQENVPIKIQNLISNNFLFRRINFGGKIRESIIESDSDTWETVELFQPNSAAIFEIYFY